MGFIIRRLSHSLGLKIILLCCMVSIITSLVIGGVSYVRMVGISEEMAIEKLASETRMIALRFDHAYEQMNKDVKMVTYPPPIQGIIRSTNPQGIDHADGSTKKQWQQRLQTIFTSMMKERPHYVQMRLIGLENNGLELVRINRTDDGFEAVTNHNLQHKSEEPYFQEGLKLDAGQTHVSRVSYNRENGQIDSDMVPTVRVVSPVFSEESGKRFGLLVINIDYRTLIKNTIESIPPGAYAVVSNGLGDYIKRFEDGSVSDFEFSHNYTVPPPYFLEKIKQLKVHEQLFEEGDTKDYYVRVNFHRKNSDGYLAIVLRMSENFLLQEAYEVQEYTLLLGIALLAFSLIASVLMARRLIKPLKEMTLSVTTAKDENKTLILPVELNDEIGELARAYQKLVAKWQEAADSLKNSNEELERFAYVSSHDLKAPLRAIDQLSNWLEEDLGEALDGENKANMQTLRNRVKRMDYLLDSLLEYSRVGRQTDDKDNPIVSGKAMLEDIVELLSPPEGFTIHASPAFDAILMRRMPLHQVLLNLINNAIKHHNQPNGRIDISLEDKGLIYALSVRDDGPGIPHEFHDKIFDMFQTLKPRDQVEGSGMGLTLVKKIISQLGGDIYVESTPGHGACFHLIWPKHKGSDV